MIAALGLVQGLGTAAFITGATMALGDLLDEESDSADDSLEAMLVIGGGAAILGGAIFAIADAPGSAGRMNEKRRRALQVGPAPVGPQRSTGLGVGLSGSF